MQVAILLYDRLTALDAIGPYEVLSRLPGAEVTFTAAQPGLHRTDTGHLALQSDRALAEISAPDIVLVPGGPGQRQLMDNEPILNWLREVHEQTSWTTSVCTGSLLLGAAGLLEGHRATSHWLALEDLRQFGAEPVAERVVFDGKLVTAAGVSAGIDMALRLAAQLAGAEVAQAIQLGIEYDPQPPWDAGSPRTAPPAITQMLRERRAAVLAS